ncbi:MAG: hypothetical protein Q8S10_14475 [Thiobacillus sp.]|nr:hypothetical protein [Thiobacillus sp.]
MNEPIAKLQQSLSNWAQIVQANTEQRLAKAMFVTVLNSSGIGGAFSGWLLAISGATIGLAISNVESVLKVLNPGEFRTALGFLFASCAAGFFARIAGAYVDLYRQLSTELEATLLLILQEHELEAEKIKNTAGTLVQLPNIEPDLQKALVQFLECFPRPIRWLGMRGMQKGQADPLFVYKRATKIFFAQGWIVLGQVLLFALFAGCVLRAV